MHNPRHSLNRKFPPSPASAESRFPLRREGVSGASLNTTPHFHNKPAQHPRLQVLTIGIDRYKAGSIQNLHGAVADADEVDRYCITVLQVPPSQLKALRNEDATRDSILQELKNLPHRRTARGDTVREGDPFLIYFAGHGARHEAPPGWASSTGHISLIVPHDRDETTHCIPDYTVAVLLDQLASISDNITVIFDCCHSGSGTRYSDDENQRRERGIILEEGYVLPQDLDIDICGKVPRTMAVVNGFANSATKSHVLLAACCEKEKAHEEKRQGEFTKALLGVLRNVPTHKISYRELLQRLPSIDSQTPQCEGYHADRLLFNALVPSNERTTYRVDQDSIGAPIIMGAGSAHGIAANARFSVYSSPDFNITEAPLATLFAEKVGTFKTQLSHTQTSSRFSASLLRHCAAFQTTTDRAATLRLHTADSKTRTAVSSALRALMVPGSYPISLDLKSNDSEADLSARLCDDCMEFYMCGPLATRAYGLKFQGKIEPDSNSIYRVLRAASQFFWHLQRTPQPSPDLKSRLTVELHELRRDDQAPLDDRLRQPYTPHGKNLILQGSVAHVTADDTTAYGITITNKLEASLHIWVFYFDCSNLSITDYYQPPMQGSRSESTLPGKKGSIPGVLPIGYGSGGGQPFKYFLQNHQEFDVGFIKIFILTQSVDLSSILQSSPFTEREMRQSGRVDLGPASDAWDTLTIDVIQSRSAGAPV